MKLCSFIVIMSVELTHVCKNIFLVVFYGSVHVFSSGFGSLQRYFTTVI